MNSPLFQKILLLIFGDVIILYLSLILSLFIRYQGEWISMLDIHIGPFSLVFLLWLIIFYIAGLYDFRKLKNNISFLTTFSFSLGLNALIAIALFYLIPWFGIAPRFILSLFLIIFTGLEAVWRRLFIGKLSQQHNLFKVLLIGNDPTIQELVQTIMDNPQIGYQVASRIEGPHQLSSMSHLEDKLKEEKIDVIVIPRGVKQSAELQKIFYDLLSSGIAIYDVPAFYEEVFSKIPLNNIEESWFLEHISIRRNAYDGLKRLGEAITATIIGIILFPIIAIITIIIQISSRGPVFFSQKRVGKHNRHFTLYKFRTMVQDAEKNGAQWATRDDPRITRIGRILRYSHLDELPQIWNIIRGDLSFVGPRPERPEFVALLEKEVPYYDIRHLVNPGITGWAQINYRYGASIQDSYEKLQYDIYYLKNRSLILDIAVILKTLRTLLINQT